MASPSEPRQDDWRERLSVIIETMKEMSLQSDPQAMVRAYSRRIAQITPLDGRLSLSRRGLSFPKYRITRSTKWAEEINPWKEKDRLPLFSGGLLAELIYGGEPRLFEDLQISEDEPALEYLAGYRTLLAIPMYEQGEAVNMVTMMQRSPFGIPTEQIPDFVMRSNLFGRATSNLVLKQELEEAYRSLDYELKLVGEIQRALLPAKLPEIPTLDIAAYYQPAKRAGGDYFDFFPLSEGKWGILIADVSGHGTPAAVLMAITHCIAHTDPGPKTSPSQVLMNLNHHLATRYAGLSGSFVTAFYAVYDPSRRLLTYSSAGHNPPRLKRCHDGSLLTLDQSRGLPLGIIADVGRNDVGRDEAEQQLQPGDQIIFYTDGITDARDLHGNQFGTRRLDQELENCSLMAKSLLDSVLQAVDKFTAGHPADDDRTIVVARVV